MLNLHEMMMRISLHIDDIIYQLQKVGGASVYWREVTSRISNSNIFKIQRTKGSKLTRLLPVMSNADVFHSSHFRLPLSYKTKSIATVYDLTYELGWLKTTGSAINIFQRKQSVNRADAIICISHNTKLDLLALYPKLKMHPHIYVVPLATSFDHINLVNVAVSKRLAILIKAIENRYVLFVGTRTNYKNFDAALQGFVNSALPKLGYRLVCTGSAFSATEQTALQKLGIEDKAFVVEFTSVSELNYLYQNAFALLYPSFYEGFGLPLLEAMSCGCPAIAANTSSLPEVTGDAGILIDPHDPSSISTALEILLDGPTREIYVKRGLAQAASFSWDKTAQRHIEIYQALGG